MNEMQPSKNEQFSGILKGILKGCIKSFPLYFILQRLTSHRKSQPKDEKFYLYESDKKLDRKFKKKEMLSVLC